MAAELLPVLTEELIFDEYFNAFSCLLIEMPLPRNPPIDNADYFFKRCAIVAEAKCREEDLFKLSGKRRKVQLLHNKWIRQQLLPHWPRRPRVLYSWNGASAS